MPSIYKTPLVLFAALSTHFLFFFLSDPFLSAPTTLYALARHLMHRPFHFTGDVARSSARFTAQPVLASVACNADRSLAS
jgi:hypothetical protein